ncbi:bifunctional diguanylate cyclase/phosphodiesterase [Desulfopila sp. IMCC35008]|uniref:putative bifunctional diguanylate cyclase/phosphodiesterase n=1 Tax=Desulfopila sp. IMCC35008 TaxID=2653858 RepID=UPI0013D5C23E|nr:bifunctional diguanylate cyclase/phosphodiesterase [Desulfopila sp. IMCC35008]
MKLSKRIPVLIIPVLFTSFFLISAGLYIVERNAIHSLTISSLEMEAAELAGSFSRHSLVAQGILASIVQSDSMRRFLDSEDDHLKSIALSGGLDSILHNLTEFSSEHLSLMFLTGDGRQEYYYENSLDPFADPNPQISSWAEATLRSRQQTATSYFTEINRIALCRVIDRITLKSTIDFNSRNTLAVILTLSPNEYLKRVESLESNNRAVVFINESTQQTPKDQFEARRPVPGFGTISLRIDPEIVQAELRDTIFRFSLIFIILLGLTHFSLQWLLQRYVVGPINLLETQLGQIDLDATQEITIHTTKDEIGNLSRSFASLYGKLKETYEGTKELAERDSLTTLYNRRVFNLVLSKLITRAERDKTNVCLMYIDIDNFKYVNDSYGHSTGDALLKAFALRLHEIVRASDYVATKNVTDAAVARLAGDEFAVIIHGFTNDKAITGVSSRILDICRDGFSCEEGTFPVTLSIGIANYPQDATTANDLIVNADSAMYESKKSGKNTVSFYSHELSELSRRQQALEIELKKMNFSEFELYYMPIVNAKTGNIHSFEALLRWFSPELGPVSPAEFIPLAESIGLYREIDMWVLEKAFSHSKVLRERYGDKIRISINISAAELSQKEFFDDVLPLLDKHNVTPFMFTLEITETFYQGHSDYGLKTLHTLSQAGFQLAIDDLGSGYTSLLQIVEFPVNMVKLDKTFIDKTIATGKLNVLWSLVDFCHAQQLDVTAEGVERHQDMLELMQAGCDYLQGFYFSQPVPLETLLQSTPESLLSQQGE